MVLGCIGKSFILAYLMVGSSLNFNRAFVIRISLF